MSPCFAGERCEFGDAALCGGHGAATDASACDCADGWAGDQCQHDGAVLCNWPEAGA